MARKQSTTADIDWYLISIDRLKKIGIVIVFLLVAGGAAWWWFAGQSPREQARRAIAEASSSLNELASVSDFAAVRADFDRGQGRLEQAKTSFATGEWPAAQDAAVDAANIATMALARIPGEGDYDAQFLTVEGDVQVQKGASGDWRKATARDTLFNGDWIKTGTQSSAELIFTNGSIYTVGQNALLEIYATVDPATREKRDRVQMQVGSVQVNTGKSQSRVQTPGTEVVVSSASTAQLAVGPQKRTEITTVRGSSEVTPAGGGAAVTVAAGQEVEASPTGDLSPVRDVVDPPVLSTPPDNHVFQAGVTDIVDLVWNPRPEASGYQLQVSRSRLFTSLEIDDRRTETSARTRVTDTGSFYWRLASVGADGRVGPFSPFRRFRVVGGAAGMAAAVGDKVPPTLDLKKPFRIGGQYYLFEGRVEPGASVFINDEEVPVETDGTFKKLLAFTKIGTNVVVIRAVDPAGNQTVRRESVFIED
ncbi:MAG: FecR domain-containing protein [Thermoanaerobaculia bacterium]